MAYASSEKPRPLEYPLYNEVNNNGATSNEDEVAPFSWITDDPDERVLIELEVSLNEYVALATAVDVGRDIAYNEDSFQIWWIWVRAYQMLDFCAKMLDCLETNEGVQNYLNGLIDSATGGTQGTPLNDSQLETPLNNNYASCDLDSLWGSCLYSVQTLNRLNLDFLEQLEALTDNQELLAYIVGAIPVIETLPIDEFIEMADKVRSFVAEFYAAGYDVDLENEMACALFCAARTNGCVLDMGVLKEYFWTEAQEAPGFEDAFQTALTIISAMADWQEMLGRQIVFCMMAGNIGFMNFLNESFGMTFGRFKLLARSGVPDDDWQLLCGDCPEGSCYTQGASFASIVTGDWVSDPTYERFARASAINTPAEFEIAFDSPKTLVSFSMYTQALGGTSGSGNTNTGSVKLYLGATLVATPFTFTRPNDYAYIWQPPGASSPVPGVVDSVVSAGASFDRIVFTHTHAKLLADVRGEVCIEENPPDACVDCASFTEQVIDIDQTFTGGMWVTDDVRISAKDASSYGGTYIALATGAANEMYFDNSTDLCLNQVKVYISPSGAPTGASGTLLVDTVEYPITLPNPFTTPVIVTQVIPNSSPSRITVRYDTGTGAVLITGFRVSACDE